MAARMNAKNSSDGPPNLESVTITRKPVDVGAMTERTTAEIAETTTLFDLEADLGLTASVVLAEKAASLARFAIGGLMLHSEHSVVDKSDLRLIEECLYAAGNHAFSARKRLDEAAPTIGVHPPLGEPVTHGERVADCLVCGAAIMGQNGKNGWEAGKRTSSIGTAATP
jgi:hypothetical protein